MLLLAALLISFPFCHNYQWTVLDGDTIDVCNNQKCGNRPHSSCFPHQPARTCTNFQEMKLGGKKKQFIIDGHNGLRNRVSKTPWQPASNMNLLHWDSDLMIMAHGWIVKCALQPDDCVYICK